MFAWIAVLLGHVLAFLALRTPTVPRAETETFLRVDLLDAEPAPPPPLPEPLPFAHRHARQARPGGAPQPTALAPAGLLATPQPEQAPPLLFNPDGSAHLPTDMAEQIDRSRPRPGFIPRLVEPSPILADKRPLKVRPNHFAQFWNGTDGKPLHETIWRYVTASKEFDVPWGGRWGCTFVLIVVACADVPDKPWNPPQSWKPATGFDEY